jgi:hypothetical protein
MRNRAMERRAWAFACIALGVGVAACDAHPPAKTAAPARAPLAAQGAESAESTNAGVKVAVRPPIPVDPGVTRGTFDELGYEVIWKRPAPQKIDGDCSISQDQLYATRVGVNPDALYIDLFLESPFPEDPRHGASEIPRLTLLQNECEVKMPALRDRLGYGGPDGRMYFKRAQLPKGDLTFTFEAFGRAHVMLFKHDDKGLRTIVPEEKDNYVYFPGDPLKGEEPMGGYEDTACQQEAARRRQASEGRR